MPSTALTLTVCNGLLTAAMQACRVKMYCDLGLSDFRDATNRPDLIHFLSVGSDTPQILQASRNEIE